MAPDPPNTRSVLVLGGARSGKSRYAQGLVEACGRALVFIATAQAWDEEMRARIARHRADRDGRWHTIEEPIDLLGTLVDASRDGHVVLVDCLTLWLSNLVLAEHDAEDATRRLGAAIPQLGGRVVFVSNEVGHGIVPDNELARRFRDAQGRLNQAVAAACDAVIFVAAGLPVQVKPAPRPRLPGWSLA